MRMEGRQAGARAHACMCLLCCGPRHAMHASVVHVHAYDYLARSSDSSARPLSFARSYAVSLRVSHSCTQRHACMHACHIVGCVLMSRVGARHPPRARHRLHRAAAAAAAAGRVAMPGGARTPRLSLVRHQSAPAAVRKARCTVHGARCMTDDG